VPIERGVEILHSLRGFTTGFAEPRYVLDTPYGKIPMGPNYMIRRDGEYWVLRSFEGKIWRELNPPSLEPREEIACPSCTPSSDTVRRSVCSLEMA
jgi:hypothetical protein